MTNDLDLIIFGVAVRTALVRWMLIPEETRTLYEFARILQEEMLNYYEIGEI